jgi:nicotinamidase-related amidase
MDGLAPVVGEVVVEKSHASAFAGTKFADIIAQHGIDTLILTGFTAHDCVVATARDAAAHALRVLVAHDATATFDLTAPSGTVVQATQVQDVALASLQGGLATVVATQDLLSDLT